MLILRNVSRSLRKSHNAFNMSKENSDQRREISSDIERQDEIGQATRAAVGKEAFDLY
jgi:hypothetical protein